MPLGLIRHKPQPPGQQEINKVVLIPLSEIHPNPNQPRKYFDADSLQELSRSIIVNGLLQPVTVRKLRDGQYELIAGERRTLAYRGLGRDKIPAIIEEYDDRQSAVLALIENLQRKDLNYFEEAIGIARLMEQLGLTQQQISAKLGKAQSTVANKLRLLRFPPEIQKTMMEAGLTERHARALLKLPEEQWAKAVTYIVEYELNVERAEQYIAELRQAAQSPKRTRLFIIKDVRMFQNSINKAVQTMKLAGIPVINNRKETTEYIEYHIKVPKHSAYAPQKPCGDRLEIG